VKYTRALTAPTVAGLVVSTLPTATVANSAVRAGATATTWSLNAYAPSDSDNVVLKWNERLLATIRANPRGTGPTITAQALAVVHTAMYDAWSVYDPVAKSTQPNKLARQPASSRTIENKSKAISYAAYEALVDLFPDSKGSYDALMGDLKYPVPGNSTEATIGSTAAQAVLRYRHDDGSNQLNGYADTTGYTPVNTWDNVKDPWHWQSLCVLSAAGLGKAPPIPPPGTDCTTDPNYTVQKPLTPQWGNVTMFGTLKASQYKVTGPAKAPGGGWSTADIDTALQDTAYLDDVKKTKAGYWADGPKSEFPPGHAAVFAQALCRRAANGLDSDTRLFFMLGNALMDASIAAWWQKYRWDFVRPVTAIQVQRANQDVVSWLGPGANPDYGTVKGSRWMPYQPLNVVTPAFPEYVSGHSTFSGAEATVLAAFNGGDTFNATYTIQAGSSKTQDGTPKTAITLSWPTFTAAADEAGWSRRSRPGTASPVGTASRRP
jgi:hypothetical protein